MWAYADQGSYKMTLREVHKKYGVYKKRAAALKEHIENRFSEEKIYEEFVRAVDRHLDIDLPSLEELQTFE